MMKRTVLCRRVIKVRVNGALREIPAGKLIMGLRGVGVPIPAVCWHPDVAGSGGRCRVCVCKVNGRYVTSCNVDAAPDMEIDTKSNDVLELRRAAEALHQFGDDALNDLLERKPKKLRPRLYTNDDFMTLPPCVKEHNLIERNPNLCVHCHLCVEVCEHAQGVGAIEDTRSPAFHGHGTVKAFRNCPLMSSECISCGQCINVCPTGALQERSDVEKVEKELDDPKKAIVIQFAPAVRVTLAEEFGCAPGTRNLTYEMVAACRKLGHGNLFCFDTNFTADLTIIEEGHELLERLRRTITGERGLNKAHEMNIELPMITSCSPGWVIYCEKNFHELLPHLSSCKSPMTMSGAITKRLWCKRRHLQAKEICSIAVMPCVAKKAEAEREDMGKDGIKDVDYVLTTREFARLLKKKGIDPTEMTGEDFDLPYGLATGAGLIFGATGGVMEAAIRTAYEIVTGREVPFDHLNVTPVRGMEKIREASLTFRNVLPDWKFLEGVTLKVAVCHGTYYARQLAQRVLENKKAGKPPEFHFIEIMACPGGCIGGGGQPKPTSMEIKKLRAGLIYKADESINRRKSHENPAVKTMYKEWLGEPLGHLSHDLLHTHYKPLKPDAQTLESSPDAKYIEDTILTRYPKGEKKHLTNLLVDIVEAKGFISDGAVAAVAHHIGMTATTLEGIISHYHFFPRESSHFAPGGNLVDSGTGNNYGPDQAPITTVYLCECIHCRLKGSRAIKRQLQLLYSGAEDDVAIHDVPWLGWCTNGAPAALIKHSGESVVHHMYDITANDLRLEVAAVQKFKNPETKAKFLTKPNDGDMTLMKNFAVAPPDPMKEDGPIKCPVSKHIYSMSPEEIIEQIKISGLRGCGGAGFPTHIKWTAVRKQSPAATGGKCIVINADEGLPNTFKDFYLLQDPGCAMRMLIGACCAAHVVGADRIYLYLRYEYRNLKPALEAAFKMYHEKLNLTLSRQMAFHVVLGGGPYICGEETALFESIEGHLPQPRTLRTIFPTVSGLFGVPTLVGNVETFSWITRILFHGGQAFADQGVNGAKGVKLFSLSGNVKEPVLAEFPMGTPLETILEECAGIPLDQIASVEVGGYTEPLTKAIDFKSPLSLEGKPGHLPAGGSIVVFAKENYDEAAIFQAKSKFAEHESCQLCAPCREGTRILRRSIQSIHAGTLHPSQEVLIRGLMKTMESSSNCGHGKAFGRTAGLLMDAVHEQRKADQEAKLGEDPKAGQTTARLALWLPREKKAATETLSESQVH